MYTQFIKWIQYLGDGVVVSLKKNHFFKLTHFVVISFSFKMHNNMYFTWPKTSILWEEIKRAPVCIRRFQIIYHQNYNFFLQFSKIVLCLGWAIYLLHATEIIKYQTKISHTPRRSVSRFSSQRFFFITENNRFLKNFAN